MRVRDLRVERVTKKGRNEDSKKIGSSVKREWEGNSRSVLIKMVLRERIVYSR